MGILLEDSLEDNNSQARNNSRVPYLLSFFNFQVICLGCEDLRFEKLVFAHITNSNLRNGASEFYFIFMLFMRYYYYY